ncbi:hypothetical protein [Mesorhizobium carmichaelinearum]|uniref:hypothetical protein n=1 Tax=Mesorhizobium carmichaelinearum TaxID=1208188 RepID=UPI001FCE3565|nr:hypothetical protein [Mesorhizobium carmichaelinearum]
MVLRQSARKDREKNLDCFDAEKDVFVIADTIFSIAGRVASASRSRSLRLSTL